jgi:hypothetical protein
MGGYIGSLLWPRPHALRIAAFGNLQVLGHLNQQAQATQNLKAADQGVAVHSANSGLRNTV